MGQVVYGRTFGGTAAENYEKYFVPTIGVPLAGPLLEAAALKPGERVLDVACGTGVVTRLAAEAVGREGSVAGLDVNPGMLQVARSATPAELSIDWYETSAEAIPLGDASFDVVLCQMGLQFIEDKLAALREMRRVLVSGGRLVLSVPGPAPRLFEVMAEGLGRHVHPGCAAFPEMVFALHDGDALREMCREAGFSETEVRSESRHLSLPEPEDFLWQYVSCTPLAEPVAAASDEQRAAAEKEICNRWRQLAGGGRLVLEVGMTTVVGR